MAARVETTTVGGEDLTSVEHTVDERRLRAFAAGVGDVSAPLFDLDSPDGIVAHPVFPVVIEWPLVVAGPNGAAATMPLGQVATITQGVWFKSDNNLAFENLKLGADSGITGAGFQGNGEGITILHMRGLLSAHMFIGLVVIPPVLLKLGSTGYRMVGYYTGSRAYRSKGPPLLPLRLMAPVLVASTIAVLAVVAALSALMLPAGLM